VGTLLRWLHVGCFTCVAFLWMLFIFILGVLALVVTPRSGRLSHCILRVWGRGMLVLSGARWRVENAERFAPKEVRMFVANHASYLDPPTIVGVFPGQVRFVMKQELMRMPFVGWYSKLAGHFLMDRGNPREGLRLLQRAGERARRYGLSPLVFPEGTRSRDGALGPMKSGAFQLALSTGMPVQPIAILGTFDILPRNAAAPLRRGKIVIKVGEPIPVDGLKGSRGRKILAEKVRAAFLAMGVPEPRPDA